jgi:hypothetical protein
MSKSLWSVLVWAAALIGPTALLAGCGGVTGGQGVESAENPGVYPPSSVPYGKTYGEWSAEWWKWVFAIPASRNPLTDPTGEHAGEGQSGPVWFLVGTNNWPFAERTCSVPAGKAVLFPIVNFIGVIPVEGATLAQLRSVSQYWMDHVTVLEASLDGRAFHGLANYRFQSGPFEYTMPLPPDALAPEYAGTHQAWADGYWIMLEPLAPGQHTIQFRGKFVWAATYPNVGTFETGVTYHLTVE